eukprot:Nk52_evm11s316 gene=Nk52_evmTU11s316
MTMFDEEEQLESATMAPRDSSHHHAGTFGSEAEALEEGGALNEEQKARVDEYLGTQSTATKMMKKGESCRALLVIIISVAVIMIALAFMISPMYQKSNHSGADGSTSQSSGNGVHGGSSSSSSSGGIGASSAGGEHQSSNIRLPTKVKPISYDLFLDPDLQSFTHSGWVRIQLEVLESVNTITLHAKDLEVETSKASLVSLDGGKKIKIKNMKQQKEGDFLIVTLSSQVWADKYELYLEFSGSINDGLAGFYRSSYKDAKGNAKYLATTQFESKDARMAFPCFDEPSMKATFKISIVKDKDEKIVALSNMNIVDTVPIEGRDSKVLVNFEKTVKMSTYLVAFIVCEFEYVEQKSPKGGVEVRVWARPEVKVQGEYAAKVAASILDHYSEFFGLHYPLPKADLVAIPDFSSGAMENWGLITYRESALLYDPVKSGAESKQRVAIVVAHELAHQWFGNYVTMEWWSDLWLNEGFASFVEFIGANHVEPDWRMWDQFLNDQLFRAMHLDSLKSSHPVMAEIKDPDEIGSMFDTISYSKGASIIRMLHGFMGQKDFQAGLAFYLDTHKYGNAVTDDLWSSLSSNSSLDIKKIMDSWTQQRGYPYIEFEKSSGVLQQHAFSVSIDRAQDNVVWSVPVTYITDSNPDPQMVWLNSRSSHTEIKYGKWIKFNVNTEGYYRVFYSKEQLAALGKALLSPTESKLFSASDRAGLVSDVFNMVRSGKMSLDEALDFSSFLVNEKDFVVWDTAIGEFDYIDMLLKSNESYGMLKDYFSSILKNIFEQVPWEDTSDHLMKMKQNIIPRFACAVGYSKCVEKAKAIYTKLMKKEHVDIVADVSGSVYNIGVEKGGEAEWQYAWELFESTDVAYEKRRLIGALAKAREPYLLEKYLVFSLDETKVRSQDTISVIAAVARNNIATDMVWRFFQDNYDVLLGRYGKTSFSFASLIKSVSYRFASQREYTDFAEFFLQRETGTGKSAVKQQLDYIDSNTEWIENNLDALHTFLCGKFNSGLCIGKQ